MIRKGRLDHVELFTPAEVAKMLRVDAKTVSRWCKACVLDVYADGKLIRPIQTVGGQWRIPRALVEAKWPGVLKDE